MNALRATVFALFALGVLPAVADPAPEERSAIFARFDHARHAPSLRRTGLSCAACHQVGATLPAGGEGDRLAAVFMAPPDASCHQCHAPGEGGLGEGAGMPRAPGRCATCHASVAAPESHLLGWLELHGGLAREGTTPCLDCHTRASCAECHDRRQESGKRVHDGTWLAVHGIAVRADPSGCDSCHAQAECLSCHASGAGWGRSP